MGFYMSASQTLKAARMLVMHVSFPREVFLFEQLLLQGVNFLVSFIFIVIVLAAFQVTVTRESILLPLVVLPMLLLATGMGLVVALISVVAEDLSRLIHTLVGLTFWITPVIFSQRIEKPWAASLIHWNPLTHLVCSARDIVLHGTLYHPAGYWVCTALSVLVFLFAWRAFHISELQIVERML